MAILSRYLLLCLVFSGLVCACKAEKPVEQKKAAPIVVVKPKLTLLSQEQRTELGFPDDLISKVELAAGAEAEPFFVTVVLHTENLKGDTGFESKKLAGFSVHTKQGDDLIDRYRAAFRMQGYLIFKSHRGGYEHLPDVISVIKGNNSYDILKIQSTEGQNYHLDTKAIIAWLRDRQKEGSFVVVGGGTDWLETRFIKPPQNMLAFAKKVNAFAPDVLERGPRTVEKLAERMKRMNGFYLEWD